MPRPPASEAPSYRWTIGLLLGVGVLVNYYDRVNLTVSHDALIGAFHLKESTFGWMLSAYSWTYAACQLPTGVILDKLGVRRVSISSIAIWGVASLAAAIAPGAALFFAARLLLGIGEAPTFPANAKAVGLWFPQSERTLATSIFDSAAKLANATGVPLLGVLLLHIGWRLSFGVTAALSFGYLALFALLYREPERFSVRDIVPVDLARTEAEGEAASPEMFALTAPPVPLGRLMQERKVIGLAIGFGSYNYVFYLLLTWLPKYLSAQLHVTSLRSFLFTGAPWLVATIAELLIGGLLVDLLIKRGHDADRVRRTVLLGGMACGLGLLGAAFAHTLVVALAFISLAIGGLSAAAPVGWSVPSMLVPNSSTGRVGGIMNFSNQLSAITAPIVTGYVYQQTHSFAWAFGIAAGYLCVGIAAYALLLGRIEPIDLRRALAGTGTIGAVPGAV